MNKIKLNKDQFLVEGRSQATAAKLVEAAKELDLVAEVSTTSRGYIVPVAVAEAAGYEVEAEAEEQSTEEVEETKVAEEQTEAFNPSEHSVEEVNTYLEGVDEEERNRVLAAEAEGKARATLIGKK